MDNHHHHEISALDSQVSNLTSSVSGLDGRITAVDNRITVVEKKLMRAVDDLQQTMDDFVTEYRRDRIIQNAYNDRDEARRELKEEFGQYEEVRKLASQIIYVAQSGFIDRAVILDVTERLAIRTPRYWLAPAILAVAAWLDGDEDRYFESIKSALALDHSKTALFMTLLLRNQTRHDDMREWIGSYLTQLEPTNLPTNFAVVIEAVAGRTLGADSAPQLVRRMRSWYEKAARSRDAEAEEIGQWERNLLSLAASADYAEAFPALAQSSPQWANLQKRHEAAIAIDAAARHFRGRFEEGADVPSDLDEKISLLLKSLANDPDPAEDQILQKLRRAEAVIETQDKAAAERRVAAEETDRTRALNILSLVTRAAFPIGSRRLPTMTELLAIVMSQRLISTAAERVQDRHQRPVTVDMKFGQWHCSFSCSTDEETTPEAIRQQAKDRVEQFARMIDCRTDRRWNELRRGGRWRIVAGVMISGILAAGALILEPVISILTVVALAPALSVLGYTALYQFFLLQARMITVAADGSQEKSTLTSVVTQSSEDLVKLLAQEQRSKELLPELQAYLLGLTPDDAHRAIRFTAPPPQNLVLPDSASGDTSDAADPAEIKDDGFARGLPDWRPRPPTRGHSLPHRAAPPA